MHPAAKGGGEKASESFSRAADEYAEALDLYAQFYPRDPELPAMFYRQGRYYFDTSNYDSAVKIWGMLLEKFPNSEQSRDAGETILESFNRAKNYENIETWARRLKALPSFSARPQQEKLDALIVVAVFKHGEQAAASGDASAVEDTSIRGAAQRPMNQWDRDRCMALSPTGKQHRLRGLGRAARAPGGRPSASS